VVKVLVHPRRGLGFESFSPVFDEVVYLRPTAVLAGVPLASARRGCGEISPDVCGVLCAMFPAGYRVNPSSYPFLLPQKKKKTPLLFHCLAYFTRQVLCGSRTN
jgi:hypothetical protein